LFYNILPSGIEHLYRNPWLRELFHGQKCLHLVSDFQKLNTDTQISFMLIFFM